MQMKCGKQQGHGISKITLTLTTFPMKFTCIGLISASVVRRLILSPRCLPLSPVRTLVPVYWALWVCRPAPRRRPSTARLKQWAAAACWTARCPTRSPPTSSRWAHLVWTRWTWSQKHILIISLVVSSRFHILSVTLETLPVVRVSF